MAGQFDVGLLGMVEVRASEVVAPVAAPKLKAILALLALGSPHPVSADRLIDNIWQEDLPANPANSLQAQVSTLRRLLGRDAIQRRGQGYLMAVGPDDVDAIRLERLVRSGREASSAGDPGTAAKRHAEALELVRGPVLGDIREFRFAREAAARLDELIVNAHEGLVDARLATGEHAAVIAELTELVQLRPHHERFHAQLIIALYRCGRQADALQAYQQARRTLLEELGVEPGAELRALEIAVLAHDPVLAAPATSAPPAIDESASTAAMIVPRRLPLVGRAAELSALRADLASARSGRGRVALVGGEPGVGKTRLAEEISNEAAELGLAVVWGHCYEGRGAPAFWPWLQIVGDLLDRCDPPAVAAALRTTAADLAQVIPAVKELVTDFQPPAPVDPESARFRLVHAITTTLRRLSRFHPLVVVLDDVHWADPASLDVLAILADGLDDVPILAIATFRTVDPELDVSLTGALVQLNRRSTTRRHDLSGLDATALARLADTAGLPLGDADLETIRRRTDGNPFFVIELLRDTSPVPNNRSEGGPIGAPIPHGVKGVVRQRVSRLPEATTRTLAFAAALGQTFDLAVLAASLDIDGATLLENLEPALAAGVLVDNEDGRSRYRFAHGLVNETVYQDMGPAQRARTHLVIANALDVHHGDSSGPHVLEAAAHWFRAVPAAPTRLAVEHSLKAAAWGAEHVAHRQAIEQLHAALDLIADMPDDFERDVLELRVQDQLCVLLIASTSYTDAEFGRVCVRIRELSLRVEEDALLVPALWRLSMHHFMRSDVEAGLDVSRQLLLLPAAAEPGPAQVAGNIALGLINHVRGQQVDARRHFEQAASLCDAGHDTALARSVTESPGVMSRAFAAIVACLLGHEDQAEREALDAFYREAEVGIGTWATMISVWGASTVSMLRRDAATTVRRCDDGIALATAGGYGLGVPYMTVNRGWAIGALGDPAAGEAQIVEGIAMAEAFGAEYMRAFFRAARAEVCLFAGDDESAYAAAVDGLQIVEATGDRSFEAELYRLRGEATAREQPTSAIDDVRTAIAISTANGALGLRQRATTSLARLLERP